MWAVGIEPDIELPVGVPGDILSAEQSNSSLIYGETAILKLFRRVEPGINPDIEIHDALRPAGNPHMAPLLGHITAVWRGPNGIDLSDLADRADRAHLPDPADPNNPNNPNGQAGSPDQGPMRGTTSV